MTEDELKSSIEGLKRLRDSSVDENQKLTFSNQILDLEDALLLNKYEILNKLNGAFSDQEFRVFSKAIDDVNNARIQAENQAETVKSIISFGKKVVDLVT